MQEAWRFAANPDQAARLKEAKGIGTPATRDTILEGLKRQQLFAVEKGKLKASELAMAVYALLQREAPAVLDPAALRSPRRAFRLDLDARVKTPGGLPQRFAAIHGRQLLSFRDPMFQQWAWIAAPDARAIGELFNGQLHAQSSVGISLGAPFHHGMGGPGGWVIYDEPEIHFTLGLPATPGCSPAMRRNLSIPVTSGRLRAALS